MDGHLAIEPTCMEAVSSDQQIREYTALPYTTGLLQKMNLCTTKRLTRRGSDYDV